MYCYKTERLITTRARVVSRPVKEMISRIPFHNNAKSCIQSINAIPKPCTPWYFFRIPNPGLQKSQTPDPENLIGNPWRCIGYWRRLCHWWCVVCCLGVVSGRLERFLKDDLHIPDVLEGLCSAVIVTPLSSRRRNFILWGRDKQCLTAEFEYHLLTGCSDHRKSRIIF